MRQRLLPLGFLLLVGCSSREPAASTSMTRIVDLSPSGQATVCDAIAGLFGGYGKNLVCDGGGALISGPASQQACVDDLAAAARLSPMCQMTADELQACRRWSVENFCALAAAGAGISSPAECHAPGCVPARDGSAE